MKLTKKGTYLAAILAIAFVAYHCIFFLLCGFAAHTAVFWISWGFMIVAFAAMAIVGLVLGKQGMLLRDWLFGIPIVRHSAIYLALEFVTSSLFVALEKQLQWGWALAIQLLFFAVYLIFAISCFLAKDTIADVNAKVRSKTQFIKLLRIDAEMLVEKCGDPALAEKCRKFAEAVRYSDPMSDEALSALENDLASVVSECDKAIVAKEYGKAEALCDRATLLLTERNRKCKALK